VKTKSKSLNAQPSGNGAVSVHIERLVLEGFNLPRAQLQHFRSVLIRELERRFASGEFSPAQSIALARSPAPSVKLSAAGLDTVAAVNVATAVISSLSKAGGASLPFSNLVPARVAPQQNQKAQRSASKG
jgi:hypothetical protein